MKTLPLTESLFAFCPLNTPADMLMNWVKFPLVESNRDPLQINLSRKRGLLTSTGFQVQIPGTDPAWARYPALSHCGWVVESHSRNVVMGSTLGRVNSQQGRDKLVLSRYPQSCSRWFTRAVRALNPPSHHSKYKAEQCIYWPIAASFFF